MIPDQEHRMGTRAASKHRCLCGRFIGTDGCGKCLHYVCAISATKRGRCGILRILCFG